MRGPYNYLSVRSKFYFLTYLPIIRNALLSSFALRRPSMFTPMTEPAFEFWGPDVRRPHPSRVVTPLAGTRVHCRAEWNGDKCKHRPSRYRHPVRILRYTHRFVDTRLLIESLGFIAFYSIESRMNGDMCACV